MHDDFAEDESGGETRARYQAAKADHMAHSPRSRRVRRERQRDFAAWRRGVLAERRALRPEREAFEPVARVPEGPGNRAAVEARHAQRRREADGESIDPGAGPEVAAEAPEAEAGDGRGSGDAGADGGVAGASGEGTE